MKIEGLFKTRSPLSHISESISTGSLLNERELLQTATGELIPVFCYNGNAWRGQLRDCAALHLIECLGINELSQEHHNWLFSGGKIGGASKFNLANIRKHFELLPHFALFGGCLDNMMLPSKLSVFDCLPLCQEAIVELPHEYHSEAVQHTYKRMTIEREFTRFDDSKNLKLNQSLVMAVDEEKDASAMRMNSELLNSGVDLLTRLLLKDTNELELGALCSALLRFAEYPFIGGQHNKGHGKVDLTLSINDEAFFTLIDFDYKTSALFDSAIAAYNQHLTANKAEILGLLS